MHRTHKFPPVPAKQQHNTIRCCTFTLWWQQSSDLTSLTSKFQYTITLLLVSADEAISLTATADKEKKRRGTSTSIEWQIMNGSKKMDGGHKVADFGPSNKGKV